MSTIPNAVDTAAQEKRNKQIKNTRDNVYKLVYHDAYTPFVDGLPQEELDLPAAARAVHIIGELGKDTVEGSFSKVGSFIEGIVKKEGPYDHYYDLLPKDFTWHGWKRDIPSTFRTWRNEDDFGFQRLNGFNPYTIEKYVPMDKFPITDDLLKGVLPERETIASMMRQNRLYMCDYYFLEGCPLKEPHKKCWASPIGLFGIGKAGSGNDGKLYPYAIQLVQDPKDGPIFTPTDDPGLWTLVKMFFAQADVNTHAFMKHVFTTHTFPETIYVTAKRNMAKEHPLLQYLIGHFWFTLVVNRSARLLLIADAPAGIAQKVYAPGFAGLEELVRRQREMFDFNDYNPRHDFKRRGVDDRKGLPCYHFRDDALQLYDIVEKYVVALIDNIYPSEDDMKGDYELQNWIKEMVEVIKIKNFPFPKDGKLKNKKALVDLIAPITFTCSARHASVNSPQFDYIGYIPNAPASMTIPIPKEKYKRYSDEEIALGLPGWKDTVLQVALTATLSTPTEKNRKLGQYANDLLKDRPSLTKCVREFQDDLEKMSLYISTRNEALKKEGKEEYLWMDPDRIAAGVDI